LRQRFNNRAEQVGKVFGAGMVAAGAVRTFNDIREGHWGDATFDGGSTLVAGALQTRAGAEAGERIARRVVSAGAGMVRGSAVGAGRFMTYPFRLGTRMVMKPVTMAANLVGRLRPAATAVPEAVAPAAATATATVETAEQLAARTATRGAVTAGTEAATEVGVKTGVRAGASQVPILGAVVNAGFGIWDTGKAAMDAWNGNGTWTRVGTTAVSGAVQTGFGLGGFLTYLEGQAATQALTEVEKRALGAQNAADDAPVVALTKAGASWLGIGRVTTTPEQQAEYNLVDKLPATVDPSMSSDLQRLVKAKADMAAGQKQLDAATADPMTNNPTVARQGLEAAENKMDTLIEAMRKDGSLDRVTAELKARSTTTPDPQTAPTTQTPTVASATPPRTAAGRPNLRALSTQTDTNNGSQPATVRTSAAPTTTPAPQPAAAPAQTPAAAALSNIQKLMPAAGAFASS
jgi:hypothetical protein